MLAFLVRRVVLGLGVVLALSFGTFWFFASNFYLPDRSTGSGRNIDLWWSWLRGLPSGRSLGHSFFGENAPDLMPALGHTAALLGLAFVLVVVLALVIGSVAAARSGHALDIGLRVFSYTAWAVPAFLLA